MKRIISFGKNLSYSNEATSTGAKLSPTQISQMNALYKYSASGSAAFWICQIGLSKDCRVSRTSPLAIKLALSYGYIFELCVSPC